MREGYRSHGEEDQLAGVEGFRDYGVRRKITNIVWALKGSLSLKELVEVPGGEKYSLL